VRRTCGRHLGVLVDGLPGWSCSWSWSWWCVLASVGRRFVPREGTLIQPGSVIFITIVSAPTDDAMAARGHTAIHWPLPPNATSLAGAVPASAPARTLCRHNTRVVR